MLPRYTYLDLAHFNTYCLYQMPPQEARKVVYLGRATRSFLLSRKSLAFPWITAWGVLEPVPHGIEESIFLGA